jgi:prepilin peptidase CpaA
MITIDLNFIRFLYLLPLLILLFLISLQDIKSHRIPNKLVLLGSLIGIASNGLLPLGFGFNSLLPGGLGWLVAFQGLGLGLVVLMPMYLLRVMGAGDVKLMAMVGSFVGPMDIVGVLIATFIAGGLIACTLALRSKVFVSLLQNLKLILIGSMVRMSDGKMPLISDFPVSVGELPFAVAISMGTVSFLIWQRINV